MVSHTKTLSSDRSVGEQSVGTAFDVVTESLKLRRHLAVRPLKPHPVAERTYFISMQSDHHPAQRPVEKLDLSTKSVHLMR